MSYLFYDIYFYKSNTQILKYTNTLKRCFSASNYGSKRCFHLLNNNANYYIVLVQLAHVSFLQAAKRVLALFFNLKTKFYEIIRFKTNGKCSRMRPCCKWYFSSVPCRWCRSIYWCCFFNFWN